jgi:hypothetical protein
LREVKVEPKEVFIAPGEPFTGRLAIRNILSRAQTSIDIKDDYLFSANKTTKNNRTAFSIRAISDDLARRPSPTTGVIKQLAKRGGK